MPELKKADELIIDDELTRALLTSLLSKWGEPEAELIVAWVQEHMDNRISLGDMRLLSRLPRNIYNKVARRKTLETFREGVIAHDKLLNEANIVFQFSLGEAIKMTLLHTILELANLSADVPINRMGKEAEAVKKQKNRTSLRHLRESLGIARQMGTPIRYPKEQIEQRSIAIIRAINAGIRDKGKVALLFYSDFDESKPSEKSKLLKKYRDCSPNERKTYLRRYHELLRGKLTYEEMLTKVQETQTSK